MDTNSIPVLNHLPQKYQGYVLLFLALSPYLSRAFYALAKGGGIKGILSAIWLGTNTPKAQPQQPAQQGTDKV